MKVTFTLSDNDLDHFRAVMAEARKRVGAAKPENIAAFTRALLERVAKSNAPDFVRDRMADVALLASMLEDPEWDLEGVDRERVLEGLIYFSDPTDLIPDSVPGLGFLDDALMVELILTDLRHEVAAYRDFCRFREQRQATRASEPSAKRAEWIASKRRQMLERIKRRREERVRHGTREPLAPRILRYK
jgi:uncharacterized membrane protein YkvA (DUF1232 family)